jgi:tetratricopeptide (TPR) repeat protein
LFRIDRLGDRGIVRLQHGRIRLHLNMLRYQAHLQGNIDQEQRGDFDESVAAFKRAIQISPQSSRMKGALGRSLALSGRRPEAEEILKGLLELQAARYISPFEFASTYFAICQPDAGFECLRKAVKDRCFELLAIKVDPRFDSLKDDPRFTELASQLGLP